MAKVLKLVTYPNPLLKKISEKVDVFDDKLKTLTDDMFETMYKNKGIGLAAPQIGVLKQIVVIDLQSEEDENASSKQYVFINPKIVSSSGSTTFEEGCLSVPGYHEIVKRKEKVTVNYQGLKGKEQTIEADGLLAICLQHEIDHLNGILFVDQISKIKKTFFRSWFKKNCKKEE